MICPIISLMLVLLSPQRRISSSLNGSGATRVFIYDPATKTTDSRSTFLPCDIRKDAQKRRRITQSKELNYD